MNDLISTDRSTSGYKLSDSHFLIGSKIHIKDFYFAKRMFQNSFFASKFAFLTAHYIDKNENRYPSETTTLIGYGLYSELLLSQVEKFLSVTKRFQNVNLNHNLISDRGDLGLVKGYEDPPQNVILIIPIVSTFSTAIKIEEELKRHDRPPKILSPNISLILVSDGELRTEPTDFEKKFGWNSIDLRKRLVTVKSFSESSSGGEFAIKEQAFFIGLPSKWYDIADCELCRPENPLEEQLLSMTDKSSVTPELIFDQPSARALTEEEINPPASPTITEGIVESGHLIRDPNHYQFYFYVEQFFTLNHKLVEEWLLRDVKERIDYRQTERVLIIAPGHFSNAGFVNIVNEVLFSNSANILHYEPKHDHIQNFHLFYGSEIQKADKVFFVDDTITSGDTFMRADHFLKLVQEQLELSKTKFGFDAVIVLLDRSNSLANNGVLSRLRQKEDDHNVKRLFAFMNLHLPSLTEFRSEDSMCPLCREKERYQQLFENSFLDRVKVSFLAKVLELQEKNLGSDKLKDPNPLRGSRDEDLKKIEAIHRIYQWFSKAGKHIGDFESFGKWITGLDITTVFPFDESFLRLNRVNTIDGDNALVLKVLTYHPFSNYYPIRKALFSWVLQLLDQHVDDLLKEGKDQVVTYSSFKDLKFLLRRATSLNANYLIADKMFNLLKALLGKNGIETMKEREVQSIGNKNSEDAANQRQFSIDDKGEESDSTHRIKEIEDNADDFSVYYTSLIKELLFLNDARSIKLERAILRHWDDPENSALFTQALRIMREENNILIEQFWEFLRDNRTIELPDPFEDTSDNKLKQVLERNSIKNHYRYDTLEQFFAASNQTNEHTQTPSDNSSFLNYLALMNFFARDKRNEPTESSKDIPLDQKTILLINRLKKIIDTDPESDIGAFFIVEYNPVQTNPYFAYNTGGSRSSIEYQWNHEDFKYLVNFLAGERDNSNQEQSNKTIIEFHLSDNGWTDLYENKIENGLNPHLLTGEHNHMLLIRINKKDLDEHKEHIEDIPQGILGFYFHRDDPQVTDVNKTRYLLMLRSEFSEFIKRHYENSEFWELREESNRNRLTLLTGHGRGTLLDIAKRPNKTYKEIVETMNNVQQFVLLHEDEKKQRGQNPKMVRKPFVDYYFGETVEPSSYSLKKQLAKMVFDIYKEIDEIENRVADIDLYIDGNLVQRPEDVDGIMETTFPKQLIEMVCFELLVNAKKNRWHFGVQPVPGFNKNRVHIRFRRSDPLEIEIRSTGPYILPQLITDLNDEKIKNVKNDGNDIAGIALIKTILQEFRLGRMEFSSEKLNSDLDFGEFIVTLKLNLEDGLTP